MVMPASANEYNIDWARMPDLETATEFITYQSFETFVAHTILAIIVPVALMCIIPMGIRNAVRTRITMALSLFTHLLSLD